MAFSYTEVTAAGGQTVLTLSFQFNSRTHVKVIRNRVEIPSSAWSWLTDNSISLNTPATAGDVYRVLRTTPANEIVSQFQPGAFDYERLNDSLLQLLYIVQEAYDTSQDSRAVADQTLGFLEDIEVLYNAVVVLENNVQQLNVAVGQTAADLQAQLDSFPVTLASAVEALQAATVVANNELTATGNAIVANAEAEADRAQHFAEIAEAIADFDVDAYYTKSQTYSRDEVYSKEETYTWEQVDGLVNAITFGSLREFVWSSGNVDAEVAQRIWCDSSAAARTVTLPPSPEPGNTLNVGRIGANPVTVLHNGQTIADMAENLIIDLDRTEVSFTYIGGAQPTWRVAARRIA